MEPQKAWGYIDGPRHGTGKEANMATQKQVLKKKAATTEGSKDMKQKEQGKKKATTKGGKKFMKKAYKPNMMRKKGNLTENPQRNDNLKIKDHTCQYAVIMNEGYATCLCALQALFAKEEGLKGNKKGYDLTDTHNEMMELVCHTLFDIPEETSAMSPLQSNKIYKEVASMLDAERVNDMEKQCNIYETKFHPKGNEKKA
jgi:hypothetical protein